MISICIPTLNANEMTQECIKAVRANTRDYEIILVDNGSVPPLTPINSTTEPYCPECSIIRNETNLGFPVAVNQGIKAAKGEVIVLLNNDCVVSHGWATRLLAHLDSYSIVGPVTNYCAGLQQVTIPVYQDEKELNLRANEWAAEHKGESQEVNWIIGFCMAFKKSLWDEIGPFDESLWPCSGEELDFCMRAKAAGHKIGIVKDVYIHHAGSQTLKAMERAGQINYQALCRRNDVHLAERWGDSVFKQEIEKPTCEDALGSTIKLNLGCGLRRSHISGFINIDNRQECEPDLMCDVASGIPYPDNSVDVVYALDFIEHLERHEVLKLMDEVYRVLKPGGRFYHRTPSSDGRGCWQDPTHKSAWNINTWRFYFVHPAYRELYGTVANFRIVDLHDEVTEPQYNIIHTHCTYEAIK